MLTLKSGKEIKIDLYALTVADVRALLDSKNQKHSGDDLLCKAVGMTVEELAALPFPDYRKITRAFWQAISDPLKDEGEEKNLVSESSSL